MSETNAGRDPFEGLLALGDDIFRTQRELGVAPIEPAAPVYEQHHAPRVQEARARLRELGYRVEDGDALERFCSEAGLTPKPQLTSDAWEALDELRGLERELDVTRWKDERRRWLPAIRRAIHARARELKLVQTPSTPEGPMMFSDDEGDEDDRAPEEAPPPERAREELSALAGALGTRADEDELVRTLFNHERLLAAAREAPRDEGVMTFSDDEDAPPSALELASREELELLGIDDDDMLAASAATFTDYPPAPDGPLSFSDDDGDEGGGPRSFAGDELESRVSEVERLFADLMQREELREAPDDAELRALLPQVAEVLANDVPDVQRRWEDFVARRKSVWSGTQRARSWLRGAARWFRERSTDLREGLRRVLNTGARAAKRAVAYARATVTNLFRVVYHSLSDVFGAIHDAAARLVQFLRGRYSVRDDEGRAIILLRGIGRGFLLVDPDASAEHVEYFIGGVRRRDESLGIALKLLGLVVNVIGSWALGVFNVAAVLRTLTTHAPEILGLGRDLLQRWRPAPA